MLTGLPFSGTNLGSITPPSGHGLWHSVSTLFAQWLALRLTSKAHKQLLCPSLLIVRCAQHRDSVHTAISRGKHSKDTGEDLWGGWGCMHETLRFQFLILRSLKFTDCQGSRIIPANPDITSGYLVLFIDENEKFLHSGPDLYKVHRGEWADMIDENGESMLSWESCTQLRTMPAACQPKHSLHHIHKTVWNKFSLHHILQSIFQTALLMSIFKNQ